MLSIVFVSLHLICLLVWDLKLSGITGVGCSQITLMIRSLITHAAFIFHAAVLTAAIALAFMGAENRSKADVPKHLLFPTLSQRSLSLPASNSCVGCQR